MNKRDINLDCIRCFAVFSVIAVHFFLNIGFYSMTVRGTVLYIATIARTFFMVCVPLFLLLTGFLMHKKSISRQYYKGISSVLINYIICTFIILIFRKNYPGDGISWEEAIRNIFSFQQYSWYVEMYIGLFLLIPFLNLIYNGLQTEISKRVLIITCFLLTALPKTFNYIRAVGSLYPSEPTFPFFPDFWTTLYPITYYFLGAYICEHREKITSCKYIRIWTLLVCILIFGTYNYFLSYETTFVATGSNDWGSVENTIDSILVFCLILKIDMNKTSNYIRKIIIWISKISFSIYLLSWIFDKINYDFIYTKFKTITALFASFFAVVPINFLCSAILATMEHFIYLLINNKMRGLISDSAQKD